MLAGAPLRAQSFQKISGQPTFEQMRSYKCPGAKKIIPVAVYAQTRQDLIGDFETSAGAIFDKYNVGISYAPQKNTDGSNSGSKIYGLLLREAKPDGTATPETGVIDSVVTFCETARRSFGYKSGPINFAPPPHTVPVFFMRFGKQLKASMVGEAAGKYIKSLHNYCANVEEDAPDLPVVIVDTEVDTKAANFCANVLAHELGHASGLPDLYGDSDKTRLMYGIGCGQDLMMTDLKNHVCGAAF